MKKTDIASIAAHQIRSPLSASNLYVDLFLSGRLGELTPRQRHALEEINFSNNKISDLLDNFLVASRTQSGIFKVDKKLINVTGLLDDILRELRIEQKKNKQKVVKNYPKVINIFNDGALIRIALQNIISNAMKYTGSRGTITLDVDKFEGKVVVAISDNGLGIPKSDQSKIFLKFHRAANAKENRREGSGIGLFITRAIIKSCGGSIWFISRENRGTTFYVSLPIK